MNHLGGSICSSAIYYAFSVGAGSARDKKSRPGEGSLSRLLSIRLILPFMGCFGDCLNHGFSLIKRITRITGSLSRSLSSRLILLLSKIELVSSTIMVSNTTYAAPADRDSEMGSLWSYRGDHNLTDCGTEIYDLT